MAKRSNRKIEKPDSVGCSGIFLLLVANFQFVGELFGTFTVDLNVTITTEILVFCFFRELKWFPTASGHDIVNTPCPAVE